MLLKKFTTEVMERTDDKGNAITIYRSGYKGFGGFKGFVWTREIGPSPYAADKYSLSCHWGVAGEENDLRTYENSLSEPPGDRPLFGHFYFSEYKPFPKRLVRLGSPSAPAYCGEHKDHTPHGLGSWFYHNPCRCAELPGLWKEGKLTHILVCGALVPDGKPATKEQAMAMAKIYDNIAMVCSGVRGDEELAVAYYLKAAAVTAPYTDDAALLEEGALRYRALSRLTGGYEGKEAELRRQAIAQITDKARKADALWRLFLSGEDKGVLEEYIAQAPQDHLRLFIAHKTLGHHGEALTHLNALIGSFGMESRLEGETPSFKAGFQADGHFVGLVWEKVYGRRGGNSCDMTFGLEGEEGIDVLDWPSRALPIRPDAEYHSADINLNTATMESSAWYPAVILIEEKPLEVFCGMHCGGVRNGLGSVYHFDREQQGRMSELQGLWLDGKLTHVRSGERLIPLDGPIGQEDALRLLKIYKNLADASAPGTSARYYEKALEMGLRLSDPSREGLLILADTCRHMPGKEAGYVTYLTRAMDRFGNNAALAWELFEFLDGKQAPGADDALRRYLDSPDGEAEKRLLAVRRLHREDMEEEAFLATFGLDSWDNEYTMDHGDFDCRASMTVQGFRAQGKFYGYAWIDSYDTGHPLAGDPYTSHSCGILCEEYREKASLEAHVPDLRCGVYYKLGEEGYTKIYGEASEGLRIEQDSQGRVLFCGMVSPDGFRHGLGTEFLYEDGLLRSIFCGYWKNGERCLRADGGKLQKLDRQ